MVDELHGLAESLGLPIAPEEQDEALEAVRLICAVSNLSRPTKNSTAHDLSLSTTGRLLQIQQYVLVDDAPFRSSLDCMGRVAGTVDDAPIRSSLHCMGRFPSTAADPFDNCWFCCVLCICCGNTAHNQKQQLDGDNDGVLDREEWKKWWVQRWQASAPLGRQTGAEKDSGMSTDEDDESNNEASGGSGSGNAKKVSRLSERAKQARRRAGTDIHTAAWRGDLALVKVRRRRANHMTTYR